MPEIVRAIAAAYYWEGYQIDPITPAKLTAEQLARSTSAATAWTRTRSTSSTPTAAGLEVARPARGDLHARPGVAGRLRPSRRRDALHVRPRAPTAAPSSRSMRTRKRRRRRASTRTPGCPARTSKTGKRRRGGRGLQEARRRRIRPIRASSEARFNALGYELAPEEGLPEGDRGLPAEHGALSRLGEPLGQPRRGPRSERRQDRSDRGVQEVRRGGVGGPGRRGGTRPGKPTPWSA